MWKHQPSLNWSFWSICGTYLFSQVDFTSLTSMPLKNVSNQVLSVGEVDSTTSLNFQVQMH